MGYLRSLLRWRLISSLREHYHSSKGKKKKGEIILVSVGPPKWTSWSGTLSTIYLLAQINEDTGTPA